IRYRLTRRRCGTSCPAATTRAAARWRWPACTATRRACTRSGRTCAARGRPAWPAGSARRCAAGGPVPRGPPRSWSAPPPPHTAASSRRRWSGERSGAHQSAPWREQEIPVTLVRDVELTEPLPFLGSAGSGTDAWLLVRLFTEPLGPLTVDLPPDGLPAAALAAAVEEHYGRAVRERIARAGGDPRQPLTHGV